MKGPGARGPLQGRAFSSVQPPRPGDCTALVLRCPRVWGISAHGVWSKKKYGHGTTAVRSTTEPLFPELHAKPCLLFTEYSPLSFAITQKRFPLSTVLYGLYRSIAATHSSLAALATHLPMLATTDDHPSKH